MNSTILNEAFAQLELLDEDVYDLSNIEDVKKISDFDRMDEIDDSISVIDAETTDEDELKDSYNNKVILRCNECMTIRFADKEQIDIDETEENAYTDDECPICNAVSAGYKIIGVVKPLKKEQEEVELEDEVEVEDTDVELDESCNRKHKRNKKKLVEEPTYDLRPEHDSRKSFYNKARVETGDNNDQNKLYSYNTLVAEIKDGKPVVYNTYSSTTLRHIKEWLKQNGFKAETSKQIIADYGVKNESLKEEKDNLYDEIIDVLDSLHFLEKKDNQWYYVRSKGDGRDYENIPVNYITEDEKQTIIDETIATLSTVEEVIDPDKVENIIDNIFNESLNETYKQILANYGVKNEFLDFDLDIANGNKLDDIANGNDLSLSLIPEEKECKGRKCRKPKTLKESDKPAATSIDDAQKWVDYDMEKYGKISERTNKLVKKAGFQIVKDEYGDYEVIAGKYDESCNKDLKEKLIASADPKKHDIKETEDSFIIDDEIEIVKDGTIYWTSYTTKHQGDFPNWVFELANKLLKNKNNKDLKEDYYRGIPEVEFIWHGTQSDPELVYDGKRFNYWDIEDALWEDFLEATGYDDNCSNDKDCEEEFNKYVKENCIPYLEEVIAGGYFEENLKENFEKIEVTNDDQKLKVCQDGDKVSIDIEPKEIEENVVDVAEEEPEEQIVPVEKVETEDETSEEIVDVEETTDESEGDEEITDEATNEDIEEFDEETTDELVESYLKNVYDNVDSFKTSKVALLNKKLIVEGVIKFNSGNNKKTTFVFENLKREKGKHIYIGENTELTKGKKSFSLFGKLNNKKFIAESLRYNYRTKDANGKSQRIYGTIKTK